MGLSFLADVSGGIRIDASWGTYAKEPVPGFTSFRDDGATPELWFRTPGSASVDLTAADLAGCDAILRPPRQRVSSHHDAGRLDIDIVSRPWERNVRLLTVTLVNTGRDEAARSTRLPSLNVHCGPPRSARAAYYPIRAVPPLSRTRRNSRLRCFIGTGLPMPSVTAARRIGRSRKGACRASERKHCLCSSRRPSSLSIGRKGSSYRCARWPEASTSELTGSCRGRSLPPTGLGLKSARGSS